MPGATYMPVLPDYADEDGLTVIARDADLALLDAAIRQTQTQLQHLEFASS